MDLIERTCKVCGHAKFRVLPKSKRTTCSLECELSGKSWAERKKQMKEWSRKGQTKELEEEIENDDDDDQ